MRLQSLMMLYMHVCVAVHDGCMCVCVLQDMMEILTDGLQLPPSIPPGKGKQKPLPNITRVAPATGLPRQAADVVLQLLSLHAAMTKLTDPKGKLCSLAQWQGGVVPWLQDGCIVNVMGLWQQVQKRAVCRL